MAKPKNLARNKVSNATQKYLDISEIKQDTVVMRDGTLRSVLLISSINFALKSEEEQSAIVAAYVSFLNNISFPLQIVIQSRELNIDNYIKDLKQKEKEQTNELLKVQTQEYIQYIQELVDISKIMSKRFYIIVPYNPLSDKQKKFFSRLLDVFKPSTLIKIKEERFRRRQQELNRRTDHIESGLRSIGLNSQRLDTQALIELYYNTYNPLTSQQQEMVDVDQLRVVK